MTMSQPWLCSDVCFDEHTVRSEREQASLPSPPKVSRYLGIQVKSVLNHYYSRYLDNPCLCTCTCMETNHVLVSKTDTKTETKTWSTGITLKIYSRSSHTVTHRWCHTINKWCTCTTVRIMYKISSDFRYKMLGQSIINFCNNNCLWTSVQINEKRGRWGQGEKMGDLSLAKQEEKFSTLSQVVHPGFKVWKNRQKHIFEFIDKLWEICLTHYQLSAGLINLFTFKINLSMHQSK